mmetsp:Transcript_37187/g.97487  ORF Transcript_37187/g.97487 Transcript_37187/m.97487 type:complete len:243 (+) Transcript_37187:2999-3727(+)
MNSKCIHLQPSPIVFVHHVLRAARINTFHLPQRHHRTSFVLRAPLNVRSAHSRPAKARRHPIVRVLRRWGRVISRSNLRALRRLLPLLECAVPLRRAEQSMWSGCDQTYHPLQIATVQMLVHAAMSTSWCPPQHQHQTWSAKCACHSLCARQRSTRHHVLGLRTGDALTAPFALHLNLRLWRPRILRIECALHSHRRVQLANTRQLIQFQPKIVYVATFPGVVPTNTHSPRRRLQVMQFAAM